MFCFPPEEKTHKELPYPRCPLVPSASEHDRSMKALQEHKYALQNETATLDRPFSSWKTFLGWDPWNLILQKNERGLSGLHHGTCPPGCPVDTQAFPISENHTYIHNPHRAHNLLIHTSKMTLWNKPSIHLMVLSHGNWSLHSLEFLLFDGSPWNLVEDFGVELIVQLLHVLAALSSDVIDFPLIPLVQSRQCFHADDNFSNGKIPIRSGTPR